MKRVWISGGGVVGGVCVEVLPKRGSYKYRLVLGNGKERYKKA